MRQFQSIYEDIGNYFKKNTLATKLLVVGVLLLGFLLPFTAILTSIALSYKLLARILSHKIFDSKFFILITSIFFYTLILQAVILISWLISHDFPLTLCGPLTSVVLLAVYLLVKPTFSTPLLFSGKGKLKTIPMSDIVPLIVCFITFVVFMVFPIYHSGNTGPSGAMVLINRVIDDPNHLGMLNDKLQFNRGVITGSIAENHTNTKGVSFYPAGWHSANAVIIKAFYPSISTGTESLIAYAVTKVFWFMLLIFVFVRTVFSIFGIYSKEKPTGAVASWIGLASLLFVGWFLIDPFLDGFYSFIPQLIIVPFFILSLVHMSFLHKKDDDALLHSLIFPALLCMGSALSWLLLFPVFVIALVLSFFNMLRPWGTLKTLKRLVRKLPRYILIFLLALTPVIVQILTSKGTGGSVSFIQGILLPGPIQTYPIDFWTFVLFGVALFVVLAIRNAKTDRLQPLLAYLIVIGGFTAVLYALQLYKAQTLLYYYFKSLDALLIALSILCIVGFAFFIHWTQSKTSRTTALLLSLLLVLLSAQFVFTKPLIFSYIGGGRATTTSINKEIFTLLNTSYSQSSYFDKQVTIFYPNNNPNLNEVASRFLSINKPYGDCYDSVKGASFSVRPKNFSVDPIVKACADPEIKITYYVEEDSLAPMQQKINDSKLQNKVTLKLLNTSN